MDSVENKEFKDNDNKLQNNQYEFLYTNMYALINHENFITYKILIFILYYSIILNNMLLYTNDNIFISENNSFKNALSVKYMTNIIYPLLHYFYRIVKQNKEIKKEFVALKDIKSINIKHNTRNIVKNGINAIETIFTIDIDVNKKVPDNLIITLETNKPLLIPDTRIENMIEYINKWNSELEKFVEKLESNLVLKWQPYTREYSSLGDLSQVSHISPSSESSATEPPICILNKEGNLFPENCRIPTEHEPSQIGGALTKEKKYRKYKEKYIALKGK